MKKENNLLIITAGSHGVVVKETANMLMKYDNISFLDDCKIGLDILGTLEEMDSFIEPMGVYNQVFPAIGDNKRRKEWVVTCVRDDEQMPILIHPTAWVSPSASIGEGTIIEANAVINSNVRVGKGVIVGIGALIDHDAIIEDYCHIDAGAVVCARECIDSLVKIESGHTVKGNVF